MLDDLTAGASESGRCASCRENSLDQAFGIGSEGAFFVNCSTPYATLVPADITAGTEAAVEVQLARIIRDVYHIARSERELPGNAGRYVNLSRRME